MNRSPRNQSLLSQISETNPFKAELAHRIFAIGNGFEQAVEDVGQDRRLSPEGKKEKARGHLEKALRELDDAQKPIADYRKQTASLRSGVKAPSYDKADISAAMLRRELRDRAASMNFGQRAALLSGPRRDTNFIDAVTEQPAWVSGIDVHNPNDLEQYEEAKQSRLRDLNGELMTALEARASVESEIAMVIDIVRNDLESDATDLAARAA
jgi:chromosome segregation ATPase